MSINPPNVPPFNRPLRPVTNITPFTYRDGHTFLELIEKFRDYINKMVPQVQGIMNEWYAQYVQDYGELVNDVNQAKQLWEQFFADFRADVVEQIRVLNDKAVAGLLDDETTVLYNKLHQLFITPDQLQAEVDGLDTRLQAEVDGLDGRLDDLTITQASDKVELQAKLDQHGITPERFGAVGDGVTDDTEAIQNFISYLVANKAHGYIPNGTYRLTSRIVFPEDSQDFMFIGESRDGVKFVLRPDTQLTVSTVFTCIGMKNATLANFSLDAGFLHHSVAGHGISLRNAENVRVDNVRVENFGKSGVMMFSENEEKGIYGRNTVSNTIVDGWNNASNGVLFVNMDQCRFDHVVAVNGGQGGQHSPSAAIQFKNECRGSVAHACYAEGWKSAFAMGGDTENLGALHCTMQGTAVSCFRAVSIGKAKTNRFDVYSKGSIEHAVRIYKDGEENVVDIQLDSVPSGQIPIVIGSHSNAVNVKYLPQNVNTLVTFAPSTRRNQVNILGGWLAAWGNPTSLVENLSSFTDNKITTISALSDLVSLEDAGGSSVIRFPNAAGKQSFMSVSHSSDSYSFRAAGADLLHARAGWLSGAGDNTQSLGRAAQRFSTVYAGTGTINTSDEREKTDVQPITDQVLDAWANVEYTSFKWVDSVEKKGDAARTHVGVLAQQVIAAFQQAGLDPFAYGVICYDEWEDEHDEQTGELTTQAGRRYGVRYDQAAVLEAALMRRELKKLLER